MLVRATRRRQDGRRAGGKVQDSVRLRFPSWHLQLAVVASACGCLAKSLSLL